MFRNYPIELKLDVRSEEELKVKIKALREVFDSGINEPVFRSVISNLHNNQQQLPESWNKKTLQEWVDFLSPFLKDETLDANGLDKLFNYLINYHSGVIRKNGDKFDMILYYLRYDGRFLFEYIALNAMEAN